ncbi:DNA (cytosine-5-)-methyltransferase [Synchytrium microbalum]|uniref:DNA (Cytosine-5-)-methyltransferase n=1 Tax=Synchytrium microbalum TaxID=1806994 RepID=A0A507CD67_9FUNG|nr:DNA (cytosine-5-)-methyltransferase [Synchytrium microbalum]TPX35864.1 DNA (cytosine-5-)-methyltransferase [Synchytrium microbalum]
MAAPIPSKTPGFARGSGDLRLDVFLDPLGQEETDMVYKFLDAVFSEMDSFIADQLNDADTRTFVSKFLIERFPLDKLEFRQLLNRNSTADAQARVAWKYGCTRGVSGTPQVFINDVLSLTLSNSDKKDEWHYSLERAFGDKELPIVAAAFDININANNCYFHNFGFRPHLWNIETIAAEKYASYEADIWTMSPPCQPYTQGGKELDDLDPRAKGLLHLISILPKLHKPPHYIFLENVPNFERSRSRARLVEQLDVLGYDINEFLLTPLQFGIANDRRRYYLTARRVLESRAEGTQPYIERATMITGWPINDRIETPKSPPALSEYLDSDVVEADYYVPDEYILKRHQFNFDVVKPNEHLCSVFTQAYGSHHVIGSGSFLQTRDFGKSFEYLNPQTLIDLKPRFFTPTECARLHGLPLREQDGDANLKLRGLPLQEQGGSEGKCNDKHYFEFPSSLSRIQCYKLVGNSLNVVVVSELMKHALFSDII